MKLPSIVDIGVVVAVFSAFGAALAQIPESEWYWAPVASTVVLALVKAVQVWNEGRKLATLPQPQVMPIPQPGDPAPAAMTQAETDTNVGHMRQFSFWYNWFVN